MEAEHLNQTMLPQATFQNSLELPKNITRFQILGFLNSLRPLHTNAATSYSPKFTRIL